MPQRFLVLYLLAVSCGVSCNAAAQERPLFGQWEGAVQIPGYDLRVVIDLARQDRKWVGSLTAPGFGVKGAPLSGIAVKQNEIEFELKGAASFTGHLEAVGVITGEYKQGGNTAPFLLKRVGDAHVDFPEPSTPISKGVQGEWKGAFQLLTSTVNVTLKLPDGGTPSAPAGELRVIDWGNAKMPITLWKQEGSHIFVLFGDSGMSYEGEFHKDTAEIAGNLRISFLELPLSFRPNVTAAPAPATPVSQSATK
jgi:hypothetical protein